MLTNVVGFFANMLPSKTVTDKTKTFAEYLDQLKQSPMACLSHDEVTYEDIVGQAKSSSSGRGYFRHLLALGGMNAWSHSSFISRLAHLTPFHDICRVAPVLHLLGT
ncbi:hypothetical protein BU15DRAFT_83663 [Melanogaster broomeanus]|nr:hypothetical protein BU15DRAFT_83663 [Melanogaster broomeanus]